MKLEVQITRSQKVPLRSLALETERGDQLWDQLKGLDVELQEAFVERDRAFPNLSLMTPLGDEDPYWDSEQYQDLVFLQGKIKDSNLEIRKVGEAEHARRHGVMAFEEENAVIRKVFENDGTPESVKAMFKAASQYVDEVVRLYGDAVDVYVGEPNE